MFPPQLEQPVQVLALHQDQMLLTRAITQDSKSMYFSNFLFVFIRNQPMISSPLSIS